jgi:hypothetical protein
MVFMPAGVTIVVSKAVEPGIPPSAHWAFVFNMMKLVRRESSVTLEIRVKLSFIGYSFG